MTTLARRGFLKVATAAVGGVVIAKYIEPIVTFTETFDDWIEDRGSFYIVRVPDYKTFSRETLDKPTIFIMGAYTFVSDVAVRGVINIEASKGDVVFSNSLIDASDVVLKTDRPIVHVRNAGPDSCMLRSISMYGPRREGGKYGDPELSGVHWTNTPYTNRFTKPRELSFIGDRNE